MTLPIAAANASSAFLTTRLHNDPSTIEDAGNGFLMRQGYTIVWCGWQGDLLPRRELAGDGRTDARMTAKRSFARSAPRSSSMKKESTPSRSAATSGKSYQAASRDKSRASLTVRTKSWKPVSLCQFLNGISHHTPKTREPAKKVSHRAAKNSTRSGFKPGHIYEFIYPAKNPLVLGLGFAVVRDWVSFLALPR